MLFDFQPTVSRKVLDFRSVTPDTFILKLERRNFAIKAGQHCGVGLPGEDTREYSLYSGEQDDYLEFLIRIVPDGRISPRIARLRAGDAVNVKPPKGGFLLTKAQEGDRLLLVSTGTGIAPFRSFLRTRPDLDCTLVHGVRTLAENFADDFAPAFRHILCLSREPGEVPARTTGGSAILRGRVTDWLAKADLTPETRVFLCGNQAMLEDSARILEDAGLPAGRIHREKYF